MLLHAKNCSSCWPVIWGIQPQPSFFHNNSLKVTSTTQINTRTTLCCSYKLILYHFNTPCWMDAWHLALFWTGSGGPDNGGLVSLVYPASQCFDFSHYVSVALWAPFISVTSSNHPRSFGYKINFDGFFWEEMHRTAHWTAPNHTLQFANRVWSCVVQNHRGSVQFENRMQSSELHKLHRTVWWEQSSWWPFLSLWMLNKCFFVPEKRLKLVYWSATSTILISFLLEIWLLISRSSAIRPSSKNFRWGR